jgi:multiple sugar transport system permease protein
MVKVEGLNRLRQKVTPLNIATVIFAAFFIFFFLFPFYWQLATSIRVPQELTSIPPKWLPIPPYFIRYVNIFTKTPFPLTLKSSFIISSSTTIMCLAFSVLSSYAIARIKIRGGKAIMLTVLVISMLPGVAIVGPLYLIFKNFKLINTYYGLVFAYTAFFLPFTMWFLTSFFRTLPPDLEEAAIIDGCTPFQTLIKIIIPLSAPAVFTVAMLVFIFSWNEFLFAFTFTSSDEMRTVPVGLVMFRGLWDVPWGELTAGSTIVALPIIVLVLVCQKYVIQGLTAGALKG